jgi:hypothetical protein
MSYRLTTWLGQACLLLLVFSVSAQDIPESGYFPQEEMLQAVDSPERPATAASLAFSGEPVVGSQTSVILEVKLAEALPAGTVLTIQQHWLDQSRLQHDDPETEAYVVAKPGSDEVLAGKVYVEVPGVEGGLDSLVDAPGFVIGESGIAADAKIEFEIRDFTLPVVAGHDFSFSVYIRRPDLPEQRVPGNAITLLPAEFDRIAVSANSLVQPGEDIQVRVRMEDRYGNLVADRDLSLDLRVNGAFRQRADISRAVSDVPGVSFDVPGVYQVELRTGGGGIRAFSNPVFVSNNEQDLLWADFASATIDTVGRLDRQGLLRAGEGYFDLVLPDVADNVAMVVQPEMAVDLRKRVPENLKLVQIVAGPGHHRWLLHQAAEQGFPVGLLGANHTRQYPGDYPRVHTGILADSGDWMTAMWRGDTYVSIGERIIILPGARSLPLDKIRNLSFKVIAGAPIDSLTLVKNGESIDVRQGPEREDGAYEFELLSDSQPFSPLLSRPRNAREWVGYIATRDATITPVGSSGWRLNQQPGGRRVDFLTKTHGTTNRLSLMLEEVTPDTVLEVGIAKGFEDAAWLPEDRLPQPTPAQRFMIPLVEANGLARRNMEVAGYSDQLKVRRKRMPLTEAPVYDYRYQDRSVPRIGDYYYLIVRLQNGAVAYSSTVFIGL